MNLVQHHRLGFAFLFDGGDIDGLAKTLGMGIVKHIPGDIEVPRARGSVRAFSFHWSNAQKAWDVVIWKDFPQHLDGAEFILFMGKDALSPVGKPWSLAEMLYVAKKLPHHPGFASSMEGMQPHYAARAPDYSWFPHFLKWADVYLRLLISKVDSIYDDDPDWTDNPADHFKTVFQFVQQSLPRPPKADPKTRINEPQDGKLGALYRQYHRRVGSVEATIRMVASLHETPPQNIVKEWLRDLREAQVYLKHMVPETAALMGLSKRGSVATWKKGYAEGQPGQINAAKTILCGLLAVLRGLAWCHLTSHWQAGGGDHLLFERLYDKVNSEIDPLAEKLVGTFGPTAVDPVEQAQKMAQMVGYLSKVDGNMFERSLMAEQGLQVMLKKALDALEALGQLSLGMDDLLRTMANGHETHIYLLQQKLQLARVAHASQPTQGSMIRNLVARHVLHQVAGILRAGTSLSPSLLAKEVYRWSAR